MPTRLSNIGFTILLALLAFGAMVSVFISTPAGVGLANDSVAYIAGARSILQGSGYSDIWLDSQLEPITHYPPLYSLSLSALGLTGLDPLRGARILAIFLFGINTALVGLLAQRASGSKAGGFWAAALFMLNPALLRVHIFALSEPLFLFFSLSSFFFIDLFFASTHIPGPKWVRLVLAGLSAGLAFLTRYSALALLPSLAISLLLFAKRFQPKNKTLRINSWMAGFWQAMIFVGASIPVMAAWFIRNKLAGGNATNRTFQFHPVTAENIQPGFYNFSQFLLPFEPWRQNLAKAGIWEWVTAILILALLIWLAIKTWNLIFHSDADAQHFIIYATVLYVFGYLGAVLFSMSFFDASTKFQVRILAPLYVALMILLATAAKWLWQKDKHRTGLIRGLVIVLVIFSLAGSLYENSLAVAEFKSAGQGYASWKWHDSLVMASLRGLQPATIIYTNTPPAVYLVTGRASRTLPTPIDPVDNLMRSDYEQNLAQMRSELQDGKAVLALFDTSNLEDAPGMQDIAPITRDLKIIQKSQGDVLYGKP